MRNPSLRPVLALCAALAALLAAGPVAADWLVTREGGRVETRGPWEVKGRLVVFTTADGQLSSMRAADVDLEASREATREAEEAAAEAARQPAEEPEAAPRPRRRITDDDIPRGTRPSPPASAEDRGEAAAGGDEGEPAATAGPAADLAVVFSEGEDAGDGSTRVVGRVANQGQRPAVGVRVLVNLYDFEGELLGSAQARLSRTALAAGEEADFEAAFPDVFGYGAMSFDPRGTALETSTGDETDDEAGSAQATPTGPDGSAGRLIPGPDGRS